MIEEQMHNFDLFVRVAQNMRLVEPIPNTFANNFVRTYGISRSSLSISTLPYQYLRTLP